MVKNIPQRPTTGSLWRKVCGGKEANLVKSLGFQPPFAIVSDTNTHNAMGERVARALSTLGPVTEIILDNPHADMAAVRDLKQKLADFTSVIAVGSGTVNDLTKFATFQNDQRYCVFATAGSMNGYSSLTASITLDSGLKVSLPAQAPAGFFVDLEVLRLRTSLSECCGIWGLSVPVRGAGGLVDVAPFTRLCLLS